MRLALHSGQVVEEAAEIQCGVHFVHFSTLHCSLVAVLHITGQIVETAGGVHLRYHFVHC